MSNLADPTIGPSQTMVLAAITPHDRALEGVRARTAIDVPVS